MLIVGKCIFTVTRDTYLCTVAVLRLMNLPMMKNTHYCAIINRKYLTVFNNGYFTGFILSEYGKELSLLSVCTDLIWYM